MIDGTKLFSRVLACAMFGLFAVPASVQAEGGWDWFVAPYLWMSDVSADLKVRDRDLEIRGVIVAVGEGILPEARLGVDQQHADL